MRKKCRKKLLRRKNTQAAIRGKNVVFLLFACKNFRNASSWKCNRKKLQEVEKWNARSCNNLMNLTASLLTAKKFLRLVGSKCKWPARSRKKLPACGCKRSSCACITFGLYRRQYPTVIVMFFSPKHLSKVGQAWSCPTTVCCWLVNQFISDPNNGSMLYILRQIRSYRLPEPTKIQVWSGLFEGWTMLSTK